MVLSLDMVAIVLETLLDVYKAKSFSLFLTLALPSLSFFFWFAYLVCCRYPLYQFGMLLETLRRLILSQNNHCFFHWRYNLLVLLITPR